MDKAQQTLLHLSLIQGIGPAVVAKVTAGLTFANAVDLYDFTVFDFVCICKVTLKQAEIIYQGLRQKAMIDKELLLLEKYKDSIQLLTLIDDDYPELLKNIHLPPTVLYVQGSIKREEACLAIIGSRKAHSYAHRFIDGIVPGLVANKWTIVSGGALGADTMAHSAALAHGGKTIAVTGSGLLMPYPAQNKKLFHAIADAGGAVVSPFALNMQPLAGNFPARNRIIAGLSRGTIVVQAAEKSGASITAYFALDQGREVFAVPGPIDDLLSAGCHKLIQQGAKLIVDVNDILVEFGQTYKPEDKPAEPLNSALPLAQQIILLCQKPQSVDDLVHGTNAPLDQIQMLLFDLQIQNKVNQDFTGLWKSY